MPRKPKSPPADLLAIPAELLEQLGNGAVTACKERGQVLYFADVVME